MKMHLQGIAFLKVQMSKSHFKKNIKCPTLKIYSELLIKKNNRIERARKKNIKRNFKLTI